MIEFLWLIPMVLIHELGHYIGYRIFGFKPKISVKWYGLILLGEDCFHKLVPFQAYIVTVLGIAFGLIPTFFFNIDRFVIASYLIMSCIDFTNIIGIIGLSKEEKRMTIWDIQQKQLKEIKEKYGVGKAKKW